MGYGRLMAFGKTALAGTPWGGAAGMLGSLFGGGMKAKRLASRKTLDKLLQKVASGQLGPRTLERLMKRGSRAKYAKQAAMARSGLAAYRARMAPRTPSGTINAGPMRFVSPRATTLGSASQKWVAPLKAQTRSGGPSRLFVVYNGKRYTRKQKNFVPAALARKAGWIR